MSRLIVKNLPKSATEDSIRSHFSSKGHVTDVKLMKTAQGRSRQFCFVGYKQTSEAEAAKDYFDKTFMGTVKIQVEFAKAVGEQNSQKEKKPEKKIDEKKFNRKDFLMSVIEEDPQLSEFVQVMTGGEKKTWTNDDEKQPESIRNDEPKSKEMSDMEFLRSKITKFSEEEPDGEEACTIIDTGRLFLRNLSFSVTENDIRELFSPFGILSEINVPVDSETRIGKGFGYVTFMIPENAVRAYSECDGSIFQGRLLHIIPAKEKNEKLVKEDLSFAEKNEEKKKNRSLTEGTWNSLFMNPNTVLDATAKMLNVKKSDILDKESDNMAVRLAIAETNIIQETKKCLEQFGVSFEALDEGRKIERSDTVILIKNIPFNTLDFELRDLFARFGPLGRVFIPPTKVVGVVEFMHNVDAKKAFKQLSLSRFKTTPLFLEWAPIGFFKKERKNEKQELHVDINVINDSQENLSVTCVYIKNIHFDTKEESLEKIFSPIGGLRSVTISKKKNIKNPSKPLSMGFGFAEFQTRDQAVKAIDVLQNVNVDGHALQLKLSDRRQSSTVNIKRKSGATNVVENCSKLLVKNIPFEASVKEVKDLFKTFGNVKRVRIPRKFNGTLRGFGFVEFLTHEEAKKAFDELRFTHFYGRHLVLEWAEEDVSVEMLRKKVKKQFKESKNDFEEIKQESDVDNE